MGAYDTGRLYPTKELMDAHRKRQALQSRAHGIVRYAVKTGRLIKPDVCSKCNECNWRIEGHHTDYNQPLNVIWLCKNCHEALHAELKRQTKQAAAA